MDALLAEPVDPWRDFSTAIGEIDYHRCHFDRTLGERDAIGADMAAAGWTP